MNKPKESTDKLSDEQWAEIIKSVNYKSAYANESGLGSVLFKLFCLRTEYEATSIGLDVARKKRKHRALTPFEKQCLDDDYERRYQIFEEFRQNEEYIYKEAIRLQLPTKPYNLLHLGKNWEYSNLEKQDDLMEKAYTELCQLDIEATALIPKTAGGKATQENLTDTEQTSGAVEGTKIPKDLISLLVAVKDYAVSRATLKRGIAEKKLKSYRKPNAPKNSRHLLSRKEIEGYYNKKPS